MADAAPSSSPDQGPASDPAAQPSRLDDLMLAMDVVDTLRGQERLVRRELAEAGRADDLKTRLREIYRSQGIDVPDHILDRGIEALEQARFIYQPPKPGFGLTLGGLWVQRRRVLGLTGAALAGLVALWMAYAHVIAGPAAEREAAALERQEELDTTLPQALDAVVAQAAQAPLTSDDLRALERLRPAAQQAIRAGEAEAAEAAIAQIRTLISTAEAAATERQHQLEQVLPQRLQAVVAAVTALADTPDARARGQQLISEARRALSGGDGAAAREGIEALTRLEARLRESYTLLIVSQGQSGIIRQPDTNPTARNHYLIVQAVDLAGEPVRLPITSQEQGRTLVTDTFGVRVSERQFDRVRQDKAADGIVDDRVVGRKRRGALEPAWDIPLAGGYIVEW